MSWAAEWDVEGRALDKWLLGDREEEDAAVLGKLSAATYQAVYDAQMAGLQSAYNQQVVCLGGALGDFYDGLKQQQPPTRT